MKRLIRCVLAMWMMLLSSTSVAQQLGDSLRVSLLTCSPGTEVYQLYGHTALRVEDATTDLDIVFNYGVFDFNTPHFAWRFVLGECDYEVMYYPFGLFIEEYARRGSEVVGQPLNLTTREALRLVHNLIVNAEPENKTYRYNFLQNNCTTRTRDMVEQSLDGRIVYAEAPYRMTYRQMLHQYTDGYEWSEQGNDILLGSACDTLLDDRAMQFLPEQLMAYFDEAMIYDTLDNRRPLVLGRETLLAAKSVQSYGEHYMLTPVVVGWSLLVLAIVIALVEFITKRQWWGVDIVLMSLQGVAGLFLCFMFLFSQHPTVNSNWQVWLFNPLPLFFVPWVVKCARNRCQCPYHYGNLLWLGLFVLFFKWLPQDFSTLTLPLALVLLTRPISYYIRYRR